MGATTKTTAVGIFVLIALVLGIAAIAIFGGGRLFEKRIRYVVYFDGSVTGLNVGSPVTFRGVKVGSVSDIQVTINHDEELVRLPVYIAINPDRFSGLTVRPAGNQARQFIDHLVRRGLRAQLQVQSLVTGQLMVDLDFYPERSAVYSGAAHSVPELPAIPSDMEVLSKSLKQLPVEEIVTRTLNALEGIDKLVNSPRVPETLTLIRNATGRLETLLKQLNTRLDPMMADAETMVKEIKGLVADAHRHVDPLAKNMGDLVSETRQLIKNVDRTTQTLGTRVGEVTDAAKQAFGKAQTVLDFEKGPPARIMQNLDDTAKAARETLAAAEKAMNRIDGVLAEDSPLRIEALRALRDISGAVRSVQAVAEYLQRHPEALLRGKGRAGDR
jgi:paraquat-inducible protein B